MFNNRLKRIESASNRYVKLARSLSLKKYRLRENLYLVDGWKSSVEVMKKGRVKLCYFSEKGLNLLEKDAKFKRLLEKDNSIGLILLKDNLFKSVAPTLNPQGVICAVELPDYLYNENDMGKMEFSASFLVILEDVSDPGNCGTIIRMGVGMGIKEFVCLGDTADIYGPKVVRASAGTLASAKIYQTRESALILKQLIKMGYRLAVTDGKGDISLQQFEYPPKCALLFGGEARGASPEALALADSKVYIPISDEVESYNVAAAAAIFLYEFRSQREKDHE